MESADVASPLVIDYIAGRNIDRSWATQIVDQRGSRFEMTD